MPSDETKRNPLNLRRKLISAESLSLGKSRIGTILNGIDLVDRRSLNNSRKITSLKNIFKSRGSNLSENLKSIDPGRLDLLKNLDDLIASCVDKIFTEDEVWAAADCTKKEMTDFLEQMNSSQFKQIESFFETMPKLSHSVKVKNPKTKKESEVVLEGLASFFA